MLVGIVVTAYWVCEGSAHTAVFVFLVTQVVGLAVVKAVIEAVLDEGELVNFRRRGFNDHVLWLVFREEAVEIEWGQLAPQSWTQASDYTLTWLLGLWWMVLRITFAT